MWCECNFIFFVEVEIVVGGMLFILICDVVYDFCGIDG